MLIHVQRNVTYPHNQPSITTTKPKSGKRAIPLDDRLMEFLKPIGTEGYILDGDQPIINMVFRRPYDSIEKKDRPLRRYAARLSPQLHYQPDKGRH